MAEQKSVTPHAVLFCAHDFLTNRIRHLSDSVPFNDIVHIFVAPTGEIDKHRPLTHFLSEFNAVGNGVGTFNGGNDTLHSGKLEESVNGLIIGHDIVLHSAKIVQKCVLLSACTGV